MNKKETLILAALKQIKTTGLYNLSMQPLAKAAKVAVGKFYYYFKSKNDLLDHIYIYCYIELGKVIDRELDNKKSIKKQFINIYQSLFKYLEKNPEKFNFILESTASNLISKAAQIEASRNIAGLVSLINQGMEQKKIRIYNPEIALQLNLFSLYALLSYQIQTGEKLEKSEIEDAAILAYNGLKKTKNK